MKRRDGVIPSYPVADAMGSSSSHPPIALRITIVVGAVTLLIGVGAALYLRVFLDRPEQPIDDIVAVVKLMNLPEAQRLEVEATWSDGAHELREMGAPGTEPGEWSFRHAPIGEDLTLTVFTVEGDARSVWLQRNVALHRIERVILALPSLPR